MFCVLMYVASDFCLDEVTLLASCCQKGYFEMKGGHGRVRIQSLVTNHISTEQLTSREKLSGNICNYSDKKFVKTHLNSGMSFHFHLE